jgi:signal transduction histidine kinase
VKRKIVGRREAAEGSTGHNAAVDASDIERLVTMTRRRISGTAGEYAVIASFTLLAVYQASRFRQDAGPLNTNEAIALTLLSLVPLVLARRWPSLAAAMATFVSVTILHSDNPALSVASFSIALFLLAQLVIRRSLTFAAALIVPFLVIAFERLDNSTSNNTLGSTAPLLFALAAVAVGESMRRRRLAVAALDATEEAMAQSTRTQTALEERARIARELHDIVAHHLSVITIKSEAARLTSPELSSDAGSRFEAIASTAREALTETRRLLGILREDAVGGADRAPQPSLAQLDELIDTAQTTGTSIRLIRQGRVIQLPAGIDLAAFRIVQEALTNARRHAPGADVDIELTYGDDTLTLRIRDYGPGAQNGELIEGHGLMGMRERAALAGGTIAAGPSDGDGFEVEATLPIQASL